MIQIMLKDSMDQGQIFTVRWKSCASTFPAVGNPGIDGKTIHYHEIFVGEEDHSRLLVLMSKSQNSMNLQPQVANELYQAGLQNFSNEQARALQGNFLKPMIWSYKIKPGSGIPTVFEHGNEGHSHNCCQGRQQPLDPVIANEELQHLLGAFNLTGELVVNANQPAINLGPAQADPNEIVLLVRSDRIGNLDPPVVQNHPE